MLEYMENVSQSEAENIRKTIQDLFRQTCILQTKCDPVTLIQKDNPHYQVCARNREFIADYLQVLDCELVHDPQEHIFRITGDGVLTERMTLLTTKLVILMKLIYRDKIMGEGLHATTTSLAEIRRYGKETNLITRRLTAQEWQELLTYDILAVNADGLWVHTKYGEEIPRRNGKNEVVVIREMWGLTHGEKILHTAHRTTTSTSAARRLDARLVGAG